MCRIVASLLHPLRIYASLAYQCVNARLQKSAAVRIVSMQVTSCLMQAYAVGASSAEQVEACQDIRDQLHSPEGALIPFCLVSDKSPSGDYQQLGLCEVNLQVTSNTLLLQRCVCT